MGNQTGKKQERRDTVIQFYRGAPSKDLETGLIVNENQLIRFRTKSDFDNAIISQSNDRSCRLKNMGYSHATIIEVGSYSLGGQVFGEDYIRSAFDKVYGKVVQGEKEPSVSELMELITAQNRKIETIAAENEALKKGVEIDTAKTDDNPISTLDTDADFESMDANSLREYAKSKNIAVSPALKDRSKMISIIQSELKQ